MGYEKEKYNKRELHLYWDVALGLQKVDGLSPSKYLLDLKEKNIEDKISNKEIELLLYEKYKKENFIINQNEKECDIVANRMVELLVSNSTFRIIPDNFKLLHKLLFKDVFDQIDEKYVGKYRDYNITKREEILDGDTVRYSDYNEIETTLNYDMNLENNIDYSKLSKKEVIEKISSFTSRIWQVHPFCEGNTRTTALFIQKHLNQLGFKVNNDLFSKNSLYFRNALVRANYYNNNINIQSDMVYLEKFFVNLLYGGDYNLDNRELYINR